MTILEAVKQSLHYARHCKSLWIFGFIVGLASGGSGGGGGNATGGGGVSVGVAGVSFGLPGTLIAPVIIALVIAIVVAFVLRFVSEGALIEGIIRTRQGGVMTTREALRAGWAHWGVLVRIALIYVGATLGSLVLLAVPCVIAVRQFGLLGGLLTGIPALVIALPWLVTLYLVQAFASRIAVVENRHARDAIRRARLFLHGRIMHGLKLIVAALLGTMFIGVLSALIIAPVAILLIMLIRVLRVVPVVLLGCAVLLPLIYVAVSMLGTYRSSIWTIGYVSQVD